MNSIGGEILTEIGEIPITNTITTVLVVDIMIIAIILLVRRNLSIIPGKLQSIIEAMYEFIENLAKSVLPPKYVKSCMPVFASLFLFILLNNWVGLLPGLETINIKVNEGHEIVDIPLFKGANADFNVTIALSIFSFLFVHLTTLFAKGPVGWLKNFLHTKPLYLIPIYIFLALLELGLEPIKYMSLGVRLFGNIFAGETMVSTMTTIPGVAVPFLILEVLVGILQALTFTGLTLAFSSVMLKEEEED